LWQVAARFYSRGGRELPEILQDVKEANFLAARDYVTKAYPGRVTLFLAREQSIGDAEDPQVIWGKLAKGGVEAYEIPGDHVTLVTEPHVRVLAEKLKACLDSRRT
jgi:thioesterase domain-containing protein